MPTMKLSGIAEHTSHQLHGYYFAWARRRPGKAQRNIDAAAWSQTVISALPMRASDLHLHLSTTTTMSRARPRIFKIHFVSGAFEARPYDARDLEINVMGFLRRDSLGDPARCGWG
ncbi:hypothetical protein DSL72_005444 [Monilinia vaccinii-corymbosi]|uniref:Uncharacterized protein n=1 Tax=Monilinia vaccinii-corymbosi TaxID=61207 RepID=A0A8A3PFQ6_9HELO|nr:hypothetical protein DSL72_005444 [Monilinia vaccinii-corymbosi]